MTSNAKIRALLFGIFAAGFPGFSETAVDSALFTIKLNNDSASLYCARRGDGINRSLSGPVVMANSTLLFYSRYGYVLVDHSGAPLDSHSILWTGKKSTNPPEGIELAFPIDTLNILYYRRPADPSKSIEIFQKKLFKKKFRELKEEQAVKLKDINRSHLFNLAHNTITDEMSARAYLDDQHVGFTSLDGGEQWWSIDRFYTFSTPLIHSEQDEFRSFFPGCKVNGPGGGELKRQLIDPVCTFVQNGRRHYLGVYASLGTIEERYNQILYICDQAGNLLYTDTLPKQVNADVVLGEDVAKKMYYTVKKTSQYVFQPSVDYRGTFYYGTIDYEKMELRVRCRKYYQYVARPSEPDLAHLIDIEKGITFEPVQIPCDAVRQEGKTIPNLTLTTQRGERMKATARDLTINEYIVRISRRIYRDIHKKLSRSRSLLPDPIDRMRVALSDEETSQCPYSLSLSGPRGMLRSFDYSIGEVVVSARVLCTRKNGEVLVRVDLENFAEILVFTKDGDFSNRFIFNRQPSRQRKDIVVATDKSPIIELDYESGEKQGRFLEWFRTVPSGV